jgi:cation diffusion facilitator CzcD-associated flavoprotein CzcO
MRTIKRYYREVKRKTPDGLRPLSVRDCPPLPPWFKCLTPLQYAADKSLAAHEALRTELGEEARRDRKVGNQKADQEERRLAFIAKLKQAFPFIDVQWIADQITPWDAQEFKARVAQRQGEYLKARNEP